MSSSSLDEALGKIRPHRNSSLAHQKAPAQLLLALESTFDERNTDRSPTAYFAALLTTLDGTLQKERSTGLSLQEGDVLPAELYLLALVIPFVPPVVIRTNLNTLLSLITPLFPALGPHPPALRSQLSIFGTVLLALDRSQLEVPGIRQSFASILQLCLDPRPKVRKKAAEVIRDVIQAPPIPLARHPYVDRVAEWVQSALGEVNSGAPHKFKGKKSETDFTETAIHLLAFLRPILQKLPPSTLPSVASSLLSLPRFGNPYLSNASYSILSDIFSSNLSSSTDTETLNTPISSSQTSEILAVILSSPPSTSDATLAPSWVLVVGNAMLAYSATDPKACASEVSRTWKVIWGFLESSDPATKKAAVQSVDLLGRCFGEDLIKAAILEASRTGEPKSVIGKIVVQTNKALDSVAFARAIPELLSVVSTLIKNLRYRPGATRNSPTAAETLLLPLITKVAELRIQKGFEFKEAADATLAVAMSCLGPQVILRVLPLNLLPEERQANLDPRAFLLPLLPNPHPSPLSHFISFFVPLSERMFDLQQIAASGGRQAEAKVWSVLVSQVWGGLVGYCYGTIDLKESLTPQFSQLLSQVVYTQSELRPPVLKALKVIVDSNVALASPGDAEANAKLPAAARVDAISEDAARQNVAFLRNQAESWLPVLFNLFGSAERDEKGAVGDVISAWAALAGETEVTKAYAKVFDLFKQHLAKSRNRPAGNPMGDDSASVTATTQDLLTLLLPYLSQADSTVLCDFCLSPDVLGSKDNGVQKRGYKIVTKLISSGKAQVDPEQVLRQLGEVADRLSAAAKKDRFALLSTVVSRISSSSLHILPSLIPEAVLGTKEPSEKARNAAFSLIVAMGVKMSEGGVVKRNMVDGMDEDVDGSGEVVASVVEYVTMIAGGLAGATPHMISATVTAISRLVFEFKDTIPQEMHLEIFNTLLVFLSSANREIVKSTLGFIKLAIHTLPAQLLRPQLKQIVPALLGWSHDHKNHFKLKVRHIFERMIRRFGFEEVYACAGEEDAAKVLVNIKKRKDRAKRKKATAVENDDDDAPNPTPAVGDAFEDVLYGSESELESSDEEDQGVQRQGGKNKNGARLRVDQDEPMDLLEGVASRVTGNQSKRRKPGQDAARFKTEDDSGKMIIDEKDDSDLDGGDEIAGMAYRESMTSVDGFTRGPNGRVKFNKDTKKRRRDQQDVEPDVEMVDAETPAGSKKSQKQRKTEASLGHEFKAKKAAGDVKKKGGPDPYAYVSLAQAAKKKGRHGTGRIGIASKK
ncbi:hypothetical protein JAAARDRAFT_35316 [Jaapia argillacea MUCL 33604]|uniref:Uncharacterized protein n=1 Tax=Jaapia argillacea MUCL 33604 TaxID=933084 RepID=A0A067PSA8_9AGAM|nr:hypothetical protein JAAARDRAFT_35316 [Jaapia argillacea MUCL 33604]